MRTYSVLCISLLLMYAGGAIAAHPAHDTSVLLWPEGAPQAQGDDVTDKPALTVHIPAEDKATGAAVIVNPGGGYRFLSSDYEGLQVARWLNSVGVTAFVLRYRLKPEYEPPVSLLDAKRAIRYVRHHADAFGISASRIGMMGFSAGGHLASAAGTQFDAGNPNAADPVERVSSRPDFLVLVYPAISGELFGRASADYQPTHTLVTADTPPTFFVQTHEDRIVSPNHSILFYQALLEARVQAEMHVFGYGDHGLGLAPGDPDLAQWPPLLARWLRRTGFLTDAQRIALEGTVTLDGEPLYSGWVTFIPEDDHAPIARANVSLFAKGKIKIDQEHGPVPGRHRVEVHVVARGGSGSKNGSYSMDDAERYTHATPGSSSPIVLEILPGQEVQIGITTK